MEPSLTVKMELELKFMPLPEKVQLPKVVAEPKVRPEREMGRTELSVIVSFTAVVSPKKMAASPETHGERVVPSVDLDQMKLVASQMPLPAWKPAAVEVSQVTVAPIAGVRAKAAARRKEVRAKDLGVLRIEVGLCASTNASTRKRVNP
jgi:hypothetical protein